MIAGLHHAHPYEDPGIRPTRSVMRERGLAVPPAWKNVWLARDPLAHIQAAGRDARGRTQYLYHPKWREARDRAKYDRLIGFTRRLPALRKRVAHDLACACICRDSACAAVIALLERGHLRIGNDEYARENHTYGATTLEVRHVHAHGGRIALRYRGKSGVTREIDLEDKELCHAIERIRALPGRRLFQYEREGGRPRAITSHDVNAYLQETLGRDFTAKDFRTWAATLRCALLLAGEPAPTSAAAGKRTVAAVIRAVAERLGHTPAICRKSYVHPAVIDAYLAGTLPARLAAHGVEELDAAEPALLRLLGSRRAARSTPQALPRAARRHREAEPRRAGVVREGAHVRGVREQPPPRRTHRGLGEGGARSAARSGRVRPRPVLRAAVRGRVRVGGRAAGG